MDALHQACHVADAALAGQRLDAALAVVLEALGQPVPGLRGRRRLLEEGRVLVTPIPGLFGGAENGDEEEKRP